MNKGRFLNQKLGKRATRKIALLKSSLATARPPAQGKAPYTRVPKKGTSRESPAFPAKAGVLIHGPNLKTEILVPSHYSAARRQG